MKKSDIKKSLIKQLESKGANVSHFLSQVDDYMFLYDQVQAMKASIKKKGTEYPAMSAAGKEYMKENPAVKNIILYNKQMLAILKELELKAAGASGGKSEDDEL